MDTPTMIIVILAGTLIAVFIAVVAAALIWLVFRQAKTKKLRQKFGPEYDYTMETVGNRRTTEEMLSEREKRVEDLAIRTLDPQEQEHYRQEWVDIQSNFVDSPSESVDKANKLITEVMIARGFPVADFEQRAADISVFYPNFVSDYRNAYATQ